MAREFTIVDEFPPLFIVMGVGGAGCSTVNALVQSGVPRTSFVAVDTDARSLDASAAPTRIQSGESIPAAVSRLEAALDGHLVAIVVGGLGGRTCTGWAPRVSQVARDAGMLVVAVVTIPSALEGAARTQHAQRGLRDIRQAAQVVVTIASDDLPLLSGASPPSTPECRDHARVIATRGFTDLFDDGMTCIHSDQVEKLLSRPSDARVGWGAGAGDNAALKAVQRAAWSLVVQGIRLDQVQGIILTFTGGMGLRLRAVNEALIWLAVNTPDDAILIAQACVDKDLGSVINVTVVASGDFQ